MIGAEPFHVPALAASVAPAVASPLIVGGELFVGAATPEEIRALAGLVAEAEPSELLAIT